MPLAGGFLRPPIFINLQRFIHLTATRLSLDCQKVFVNASPFGPPSPYRLPPSLLPSPPLPQHIGPVFPNNNFQLPSGLLINPAILPSTVAEVEYKCINDIRNRRRKMKKHKRKKWRKKFASLVRKFRTQRERKAEKKLQELLELWRNRTEAWDPAKKIEQRLVLARRSGYYDITKPNPEDSNPVSDTLEGQRALLEATSIIRDLTLALNRVYENIRDVQGTRRLNADLSKNFKERVETFQHCRNTIKKTFSTVSEACSRLGVDNPEDIIPYDDVPGNPVESNTDSKKLSDLKMEREFLLRRIAEVDGELLKYREVLTSALWELNDLMHPITG